MSGLPDDPNVLRFLAAQNELRSQQVTHRLMHMAGSFGRPGSLTEGGRRHRLAATDLSELNLLAIVYAAQRGWIDVNDVQLPDEPFGGIPPRWHVEAPA